MKVVHLNTYDGNGGAGRAVLRLNHALKDIGVHSEIVTLYQFNKKSNVYTYANTLLRKCVAIFNILSERFLVKLFTGDKTVPFSLQRFGVSLSSFKNLEKADIIHIHWINHGFLNPKNVQRLSLFKGKRIFWTLHDSNPITGGCHVRYDCAGFSKECGYCPVLMSSKQHDLSNKTWQMKNNAYQKLNFQLIAPSKWMQKSAQEASLTKTKTTHFIANALDTDFFKPKDKLVSRDNLNLPKDCFIVLAGYMPSTSDRHKGFQQLKEAMRELSNMTNLSERKLLLLFYGSDDKKMGDEIQIPHLFFGKITDDNILADLYNSADVFLFPSIEESMGYTALESIACGTPVVAFNTSGVTDVIRHKINGYLANLYDSKGLAEGIIWVMDEADRNALSENSRNWAVSEFSLKIIAQRHSDLYKSALMIKNGY